jgi:hypothetical protein
MNKLLLLLLLIGLVSCQPKDQPSDVAARASGAYAVRSFVVDGDTLYSTSGKNKLGISNFYIGISRKASDTVAVSYAKNVPNSFVLDIGIVPVGGIRIVSIAEVSGKFRLFNGTKAPFVYESSIDGNRFYERTIGYNMDSLAVRLGLDSLRSPYTPPLREIIISAEK